MQGQERYDDLQAALRIAMDGLQARLWTALPGFVKSFDSVRQTCEVQTTIQCFVSKPDGSSELATIPLCVDCPVFFPQGGGFCLTFPIAEGDECLLVFASRCIDSWWQQGADNSNPARKPVELRMHSLSDGFAFFGFRSQPRKLVDYSVSNVSLRSDDGETFIDLTPSGSINIQAPAGLFINADMNITGSVSITGTLTVNGVDAGELHTHGGVVSGTSSTLKVNP